MPESLFLHELKFLKPAGTSRGVLYTKPSWIYQLSLSNGKFAQTEFPVIPGLSPEYIDHIQYEQALTRFITLAKVQLEAWSKIDFLQDQQYQLFISNWQAYPSFVFGLELLLFAIQANGSSVLFNSSFTDSAISIPINGLVWMGNLADMRQQAQQKISAGFQTVKLKIGALDWQQELSLLAELRAAAPATQLTIRVDANGAFSAAQAREVLKELARLEVHSIEQPIAAGQPKEMAELAALNLVPIALDEELIGVHGTEQKDELLETIRPPFIILKPTLHGGITGCEEWITLVEHKGVNWWATSALESNIGLNAIAQWLATKQISLPQGLGTGGLYSNNFHPAWDVSQGYLKFNNIQELNQDIILLK